MRSEQIKQLNITTKLPFKRNCMGIRALLCLHEHTSKLFQQNTGVLAGKSSRQ